MVTLVCAHIGITGMGNKNSRDGEVVRMPHGLALISSSLKRNGFSVGLIDMRIVDGWNEFEEKPHFHNWFKCEEYPCRTYCSSATLYKYETHFPTLTKIFTAMGWSLEPLNH